MDAGAVQTTPLERTRARLTAAVEHQRLVPRDTLEWLEVQTRIDRLLDDYLRLSTQS